MQEPSHNAPPEYRFRSDKHGKLILQIGNVKFRFVYPSNGYYERIWRDARIEDITQFEEQSND